MSATENLYFNEVSAKENLNIEDSFFKMICIYKNDIVANQVLRSKQIYIREFRLHEVN